MSKKSYLEGLMKKWAGVLNSNRSVPSPAANPSVAPPLASSGLLMEEPYEISEETFNLLNEKAAIHFGPGLYMEPMPSEVVNEDGTEIHGFCVILRTGMNGVDFAVKVI